jgi:ABC-type dipeptide/oligopeptide/nickel transport system ATPase component
MTLRLQDLSVSFDSTRDIVRAVDRVSMSIGPGERTALVGESGCGKTVLALALLGLLPRNARIAGTATLGDQNLLEPATARSLRGKRIGMCWSNAERFFNPLIRVGRQISEAYLQHHPGERKQAKSRALGRLEEMGFADPNRVYDAYPFQLSGGMNQRAMIAMSLMNQPQLLLVDEPTRGLDDESRDLVVECLSGINGISILLITHDIDLTRHFTRSVYVMRNGAIVDSGACPAVLDDPAHPYVRLLMEAALFSRRQTGQGVAGG